MNPSVALSIFLVGIAGLFYLDRDEHVRTSKALWLPVIWLWIVGSRGVSSWFGIAAPSGADAQLDGSPIDRLIFLILLVAAISVLMSRAERTRAFLMANWPILIYFLYCLVSILWSDFPDVSAKRWIKAIGDLAMVLVVLTETEPIQAFRRFISRVSFMLLPLSIVLIRYFDVLGHSIDVDGNRTNTGVTTNKNSLGVITMIFALGVLWTVLELLRDKARPNRGRHLVAQGTVLAFGIALLFMAHSATAAICFILGATLMFVTGLPMIKRRPAAVHALVLVLVLGGGLTMFLGGQGDVAQALGRQADFTGRTEIWAAVIPAVPNTIVGAGFESFWLGGPWMSVVYRNLSGWMNPQGLNEAHNGYIEVYLNLGWVGVGLIAAILFNGYRRAVTAYRRNPAMGGLMLAYVVTAALYNVTEAGFRLLNPMWIFLLLAVVAASGIASGAILGTKEALGERTTTQEAVIRSRRVRIGVPTISSRVRPL